jgi:outer membrane protein TolC
MYKYALVFIIITSYNIQAFAQLTLEECQQKARDNYPLIKQYELIEQSKNFNLSNANKAYLPRLDLNIIGGIIDGLPTFTPPGAPESSSSVELNLITIAQLNQVIWDGGITKVRKEMTEATANIEIADLEVSLYALEERVNNLFFGILLIDEQIKQVELLKTTLERNMKRVQNAVDGGTGFKTDIDEIKVEMINANQKIEELRYNRSAYLGMLSAMIGENISENSALTKPNYEKLTTGFEINRPELSLFHNQKFLVEAQLKMEKTSLYPKVGLLGLGVFIQPGAEFGASTINNLLVGGLSLNWSIGGLYINPNNKKLGEIKLQKIENQKETFLFNTNLGLTQTQQALNKYKKLIEQDRELLALKTKIANAYEIKYENGIATMTELLNRTNEESLPSKIWQSMKFNTS